MINKKKVKYYFIIPVGIVVLFFVGVKLNRKLEWEMAKAAVASGGYPTQIGLTKVVKTQCVQTSVGCQPLLCFAASPCKKYANVAGVQAGGTSPMGLFSLQAIEEAMLEDGDEFISGGTTPVTMDSGVLATAKGCSGCTPLSALPLKERILKKFDFLMAGFRN